MALAARWLHGARRASTCVGGSVGHSWQAVRRFADDSVSGSEAYRLEVSASPMRQCRIRASNNLWHGHTSLAQIADDVLVSSCDEAEVLVQEEPAVRHSPLMDSARMKELVAKPVDGSLFVMDFTESRREEPTAEISSADVSAYARQVMAEFDASEGSKVLYKEAVDEEVTELECDSVMKKRRRKMNKHKHRKAKKKQRFLLRKLGKI